MCSQISEDVFEYRDDSAFRQLDRPQLNGGIGSLIILISLVKSRTQGGKKNLNQIRSRQIGDPVNI